MDEINLLLQEAAEADRLERLNGEYELFQMEMYYYLECDQWERDKELNDG